MEKIKVVIKPKEFDQTRTYSAWTFTCNNYTESDEQLFQNLACNFIVYGREIGKNGTPHLQGYIKFKTGKRFAGMKKLHSECHWEPAKDEEAATNYCMKDKDYFIKDNRQQGNRTDLQAVINAILIEKKNSTQIAQEYPHEYIKYHGGIERLLAKVQPMRTEKPIVIWLYGPTGCGKTRYVFDKHGIENVWTSMVDLSKWEGYEQQEVILVDDFRKNYCTFGELLKYIDRYPLRCNIKYTSAQINSKYMYFTCPYHPKDVYPTREDVGQLIRRIDFIIDVSKVNPKDLLLDEYVREVANGNTKHSPQPIETIGEFEDKLDRVLALEVESVKDAVGVGPSTFRLHPPGGNIMIDISPVSCGKPASLKCVLGSSL